MQLGLDERSAHAGLRELGGDEDAVKAGAEAGIAIDDEGAEKAARFLRFCDCYALPVVSI